MSSKGSDFQDVMNTIANPDDTFLKQKVETGVVSIGQKNILPTVAPKKNMIKSTVSRIKKLSFLSEDQGAIT